MLIRQIENTPLGNYYHDQGIEKIFNHIKENVDEFELESDTLHIYIDTLTDKLKGLKNLLKKVEAEQQKKEVQQQLRDEIRGYE